MPNNWYEHKLSPQARERKSLDFGLELKSLRENGFFSGYASVFDLVDSQRDVILPGAFRETLQGRVPEIKLLWQHHMDEPIGVIHILREDEHGLYVEGQLLLELARAKEAYALLKKGVLGGLSIGYSPTRYTVDPDSGVRRLSAVQLYEISLVTFPANAAARVQRVKKKTAADIVAEEKSAEWQQAKRAGQVMALADALARACHMLKT